MYLVDVITTLKRSIRNEIEHQDAAAPSKDRCEEFLEFTWYFLRSTDKLSTNVLNTFTFEAEGDSDSPYWINVTTGPDNEWQDHRSRQLSNSHL
ncbi:MAG: hypothetical protein QME52_12410 [Bacteroidota bacterium]|nr:hypothetical protein [Bacteroidota bacterium]